MENAPFVIQGYTAADGRFALSRRLGRGAYSVRVNSHLDQRDVTASACPGGSCASARETILGVQAAPGTIRVRSTGPR